MSLKSICREIKILLDPGVVFGTGLHPTTRDCVRVMVHLQKEWYLFSGLMRSQVRDMKVLMTRKGLKVFREWDHEMTWYTLLVKNTGMSLE